MSGQEPQPLDNTRRLFVIARTDYNCRAESHSLAPFVRSPDRDLRPASASVPKVTTNMDILPSGNIFKELAVVHETGFLSAQLSLEDKWQQVRMESALNCRLVVRSASHSSHWCSAVQ